VRTCHSYGKLRDFLLLETLVHTLLYFQLLILFARSLNLISPKLCIVNVKQIVNCFVVLSFEFEELIRSSGETLSSSSSSNALPSPNNIHSPTYNIVKGVFTIEGVVPL
jgi:hypothetical protein